MVTLQQFQKANKERKLKLAIQNGYSDVEEFRKFLKNIITFEKVVKNQKLQDDIPTIHIVNIVDCSGSMRGSKIDAANEMVESDIEKVKTTKDVKYTYTLRTFDSYVHDYKCRFTNNPVFKKLKADSLTALYDAIGYTLNDLKSNTTDKFIVSIITDRNTVPMLLKKAA